MSDTNLNHVETESDIKGHGRVLDGVPGALFFLRCRNNLETIM